MPIFYAPWTEPLRQSIKLFEYPGDHIAPAHSGDDTGGSYRRAREVPPRVGAVLKK